MTLENNGTKGKQNSRPCNLGNNGIIDHVTLQNNRPCNHREQAEQTVNKQNKPKNLTNSKHLL